MLNPSTLYLLARPRLLFVFVDGESGLCSSSDELTTLPPPSSSYPRYFMYFIISCCTAGLIASAEAATDFLFSAAAGDPRGDPNIDVPLASFSSRILLTSALS